MIGRRRKKEEQEGKNDDGGEEEEGEKLVEEKKLSAERKSPLAIAAAQRLSPDLLACLLSFLPTHS